MHTEKGTFEVEMQGEPPFEESQGVTLSRMTVAKTFEGPRQGTSTVHMMAARSPVEGSAGYVALERITGSLAGRDSAT